MRIKFLVRLGRDSIEQLAREALAARHGIAPEDIELEALRPAKPPKPPTWFERTLDQLDAALASAGREFRGSAGTLQATFKQEFGLAIPYQYCGRMLTALRDRGRPIELHRHSKRGRTWIIGQFDSNHVTARNP